MYYLFFRNEDYPVWTLEIESMSFLRICFAIKRFFGTQTVFKVCALENKHGAMVKLQDFIDF